MSLIVAVQSGSCCVCCCISPCHNDCFPAGQHHGHFSILIACLCEFRCLICFYVICFYVLCSSHSLLVLRTLQRVRICLTMFALLICIYDAVVVDKASQRPTIIRLTSFLHYNVHVGLLYNATVVWI